MKCDCRERTLAIMHPWEKRMKVHCFECGWYLIEVEE